jgi:TetR/AcrR family transcriptional repressor of nem operon
MPRDGRPTRDALLDAAQTLILENGFAATTVDAVIGRAGLTKGAFFHHFASKAALAETLLRRYAETDGAHLERHITRAEALSRDPLQQVLIALRLYEEEAAQLSEPFAGCLYASFCYESQLFDDKVLAIIRETFANTRRRVAVKLSAAMARHPTRFPVNAESLVDLFISAAEGAFVLSRIEQRAGVLAEQFRHVRNYFELLFEPAPVPTFSD